MFDPSIKPGLERTDKSKDVTDLKKLFKFLNKAASKEARRQSRCYKTAYDLRIQESQLLVEKVGVRGKGNI